MAFVDYTAREINCKLVYWGPGMSGRTTNMQYIYNKTRPEHRTKLISLATENERTMFFSFAAQWLSPIRGLGLRFHPYTVPGSRYYEVSLRLVLKGVDGIVFVADSQPERHEANVGSLEVLKSNLATYGYDLRDCPLVMQYNKRDMPGASSVADLDALLRTGERPRFEAVATTGFGVFDTLHAITGEIATRLRKDAEASVGRP